VAHETSATCPQRTSIRTSGRSGSASRSSPGAAFDRGDSVGLPRRPKGVAGLHLGQIRAQALQVTLFVLAFREGDLPLAPLPRNLFAEALGLIHDFLVLLVAARVEARDDLRLPGLVRGTGLQAAGLAPRRFDAPSEACACCAVRLRAREEADGMLQRKGAQAPHCAPDGGAGGGGLRGDAVDHEQPLATGPAQCAPEPPARDWPG